MQDKIKCACGVECYTMIHDTEKSASLVAQGHCNNKFFDYEIYRIIYTNGKVLYQLLIDGDEEGHFKSIRDARKYAENLF